jgi:hypothetical protein
MSYSYFSCIPLKINEVIFKITIGLVIDQIIILKDTSFLEDHKKDMCITSRITRLNIARLHVLH